MAFTEEVYRWRRIVPLRLVRAVTGAPRWNAPEVDDRGWLHDPAPTTPPGPTRAEVHGPVIGMTRSTEASENVVRVKIVRERIDPGAALYIKSRDTNAVEIVTPATGHTLPADGIVHLRAKVITTNNKFAVVEVRHASDTGPVIFEFGVRVFKTIPINVQPHRVRINGTLCTTNQAGIDDLRRVVNRIWRPAGIYFRFRTVAGHTVTRTGFANAGEITYNDQSTPQNWAEFYSVIGQDRVANHVNLYFIRRFTNVGFAPPQHTMQAGTLDRVASSTNHGVIMTDSADGNDLAHELGHFLSLDHPDEVSNLKDVDSRRRLMFRYNPYSTSRAYRRNVGYGNLNRGALITMRNKPQDRRDNDWNDSRTRARNPF